MMVGFAVLYPDKNVMVCCSNFSDLVAAILNFVFYKNHKDENSKSAQISPSGNQPSIIKTEKKHKPKR